MMIKKGLLAAFLVATVSVAWAAEPAGVLERTPPLTKLSLEDLMNVNVTSVSKKAEPLSGAAAAVYVLSGEEIRRSGATTIADALRLVPGMVVGSIDSNKWAINARDWPSRFANKLLVLVDGRTIYTPLFGGVWWEHHDLVFEDIDRIEVIRGPGATLWGANAINGVINIITKSAKETQGGLVTLGAGTEEKLFGHVRYGGKAGEHAWYRVWAKSFDRDSFVDATGADLPDDWSVTHTGFRFDWDASDADVLTVEGEYFDGQMGQVLLAPVDVAPFVLPIADTAEVTGGNVLARWVRTLDDDSELALQVYYDRTERAEAAGTEERDTGDIDLQHRFRPSDRHDIVWGLRCRITTDELAGSSVIWWEPAERTDYLYSAFIQDEITLTPDHVSLTIGTKVEHNDYTGFEYQPSARIAYTPSPRRTLWAAISRAIRTPDRSSVNMRFISLLDASTGTFGSYGGGDLESEELLAYELGYRVQPSERFSLDAAAYYHDLDKLTSWDLGMPAVDPGPPPRTVVPITAGNRIGVDVYGLELALNFAATDHWRLRGGYSFMHYDATIQAGSADPGGVGTEESYPPHIAFLRSSADLSEAVQLDVVARYVDARPAADTDSYVGLDARVAWHPMEQLELFVVGRNLLEDHHAEAIANVLATERGEVERSVYAGLTWRF